MTDKPFGVDTLLPASVRREAYKGKAGPSPMDMLPEYQKFAQDFLKKENIPPLKSRAREWAARLNFCNSSSDAFMICLTSMIG